MADVEVDSADISVIYRFAKTFPEPGIFDDAIVHALEAAHAKAEGGIQPVELRLDEVHLQTLADRLVARSIKLAASPDTEQTETAPVFARVGRAILEKLGAPRSDPEQPEG